MINITGIVRTLTWAWVIIIGALMITPDGVFCIACNPGLIRVLGAISILIGVAAFAVSRQNLTANTQ